MTNLREMPAARLSLEDYAARMIQRHAKKDAPFLFQQQFVQACGTRDPLAKAAEIDARHQRWCDYWKREGRETRFWPRLAAWVADGSFTVDPPQAEPPKAAQNEALERLRSKLT